MISYDEIYSQSDNVFGENPEKILTDFAEKIRPKKKVLDIGAGEGRNALYLAGKGFAVDALEPSAVAARKIAKEIDKKNFEIKIFDEGFESFNTPQGLYSAVLVFGLIQILRRDEINLLVSKINSWTEAGGLIFVTAFSTKDSSFNRLKNKWAEVGKNSFKDSSGNIRTYLEPGEILDIFNKFQVLFHSEHLGPKHRHGDGGLEQHEMIEFVGRKK
jgi:tellurite methyltransferase